MAIWDFSQQTLPELRHIRELYLELEGVNMEYDEDMMRELEAEIALQEQDTYTHIISFVAINNESYEEIDQTIYLHHCPKDRREIQKMVKATYDGVWEPQMDRIELFELKAVI